MAAAHLTRAAAPITEALGETARQHLAAVLTASADEAHERAMFLHTANPVAPVVRSLRRLHSDMAMLGRAIEVDPSVDGRCAAPVIERHFEAAAALARGVGSAPDFEPLDSAIADVPASTPLAFALATLRRDLTDLSDRLTERMTG